MTTNNGTNKFAVRRLQEEIKQIFSDLIDLTDLAGTRVNKDTAYLSRGLAAYALYSLAGTSPSEAAESVIDGQGDNGIDAIYWHKNDNILWLIQSKWIEKGTGQPDYKDINTFVAGVRNLIEDNLDRPNSRLSYKKEEADEALSITRVKVKIVITHTGKGISRTSRKCLEDLIQDLNRNDDDDTFQYEILDKDKAYEIAVENANRLDIETEFNLINWGKLDSPYTSFYGQVAALDLAKLWVDNRNNLFANNLRDFIGQTKANDEITQTLKDDPSSFWYFNNGLTILCQEIRRKTKGTKRLEDTFLCKGISIINGAQTIGSIGRFYEEDPEGSQENLEQVDVFVKLISLQECPEGFGVKVTRATNTQNQIEDRDFIALDPIQLKLARELKAWDRNKVYYYKRSHEMVSGENSCTLTEVTEALACYSSDVELTAIVKKDISQIWSDVSSSLYKRLFNPSVSPIRLWRSVEISRFVGCDLTAKSKDSKQLHKIATHANLFIVHLVFQEVQNQGLDLFRDDINPDDYNLFLPGIIESRLKITQEKLAGFPASTRLGVLFKNPTKCAELKREILGA